MNRSDMTIKLDEFILELKYQEKSDRTLAKYRNNINGFIEFIQHDEDITKDDVLSFKKSLTSGEYKPATINSYIVVVNKFIRWCGEDNLSVKKLKQQQKSSLEDVVSPNEYKRLLRFAKQLGYEDIYLIMKIIASSGIRISELDYFTVENVKKFYIHVRNKGKDRDIILIQDLARELRKYCRDRHIVTGRIFQFHQRTVRKRMKKVAGAARVNLSKVHPHSFRHLFAKSYMEEFNNVLELADILGHSSLETTRIYTRSTNAEKRKRMEEMGDRKVQINANKER
ncbi:MAG TPA: hypothetical protein DCQ90_06525 [Erysipelotrichaceae bacterium]|nr:hypothetical protein [Erysipelotrichaceae bacterium]